MKTFYVGIKGVVINDGKVLVLRANHFNGRQDIWEMPGGRIDEDETTEQALRRELLEEVPNIKEVKVHEALDAYRVHMDIQDGISLVLIFYRVTASFDGDPEISEEHIDWRWATEAEALKLAHHNCHAAIARAFKNI